MGTLFCVLLYGIILSSFSEAFASFNSHHGRRNRHNRLDHDESRSVQSQSMETHQLKSSLSPQWVEGPCVVDNQLSAVFGTELPKQRVVSSQECVSYCDSNNLDIAGIRNGGECFCSLSLNEATRILEASEEECSSPCISEIPQQMCGGPERTRLFGRNGALDRYGFGFTRIGSLVNLPLVDNELNNQNQYYSPIQSNAGDDDQENVLQVPNLPIPGDSTTTTSSTQVPVKAIIAHHMVGNVYSYTLQSWINDISLAKSAGIDGFALNLGSGGPKSWQRERIGDAFRAADGAGGFGMIFSFDMTVLRCDSQEDADILRDYLMTWGPHPGHLTLPPVDGSPYQRILVSTFAGEYCTFGRESVKDGWLSVIANPEVVSRLNVVGKEIAFVPSWFARVEDRRHEFSGAIHGDFFWNGGWPYGNRDVDWEADAYRLRHNPGPLYMASVSPAFFTHYGPNSFNKNWIYRSDDWLYASRWEMLIDHRNEVSCVEIVTWNDYGESSYIGPIEGDQPNSEAWVDGFPHLGFLDMTAYYAQAFKTGTYPPIRNEKVYIWSRPHSRDANAPDSLGRPNFWDWTEDYLWAIVFAASDGEFALVSGSNSQTFPVKSGVNKFKLPNAPGPIRGTLKRLGVPIIDVNPKSDFDYTLHPHNYNFNYFMAHN